MPLGYLPVDPDGMAGCPLISGLKLKSSSVPNSPPHIACIAQSIGTGRLEQAIDLPGIEEDRSVSDVQGSLVTTSEKHPTATTSLSGL